MFYYLDKLGKVLHVYIDNHAWGSAQCDVLDQIHPLAYVLAQLFHLQTKFPIGYHVGERQFDQLLYFVRPRGLGVKNGHVLPVVLNDEVCDRIYKIVGRRMHVRVCGKLIAGLGLVGMLLRSTQFAHGQLRQLFIFPLDRQIGYFEKIGYQFDLIENRTGAHAYYSQTTLGKFVAHFETLKFVKLKKKTFVYNTSYIICLIWSCCSSRLGWLCTRSGTDSSSDADQWYRPNRRSDQAHSCTCRRSKCLQNIWM